MIAGTGVDIVRLSRLDDAIRRHGELFLNRVFTPAERQYAASRGKSELAVLGGRWAAKEASAKALGCGIGRDCSLTDMEILPDSRRKPILTLSGAAADFAARNGGGTFSVSVSHEEDYAVAFVIWEKPL